MIRVLVALGVALIGLVVFLIVAPFLLVAALLFALFAWRRPATAERLSAHPRMAPVPTSLHSTPMRLAASLVVLTLALTAASAAIAGSSPDAEPEATVAADQDATATPEPTPEPTTRPTPRATPEPTPTPSPIPKLGAQPIGATQTGTVVNVVDGDTIDVLVAGEEIRVRLIGVDTPEVRSGAEWLGPEAHEAMTDLVLGQEVVLEMDVSETDRYGRALRHVWLADGDGWKLLNLELVRLGFAIAKSYPPDTAYDSLYRAAQGSAQAAGLELWGATPTPVPTAAPTPVPVAATPVPVAPQPSNCHASYVGYCVTAGIGDWDCASGSGNGPNYLPVTVQVVGHDEYGLDGNGDGYGCE